jgi:hypothetical protein
MNGFDAREGLQPLSCQEACGVTDSRAKKPLAVSWCAGGVAEHLVEARALVFNNAGITRRERALEVRIQMVSQGLGTGALFA